MPFISGLVHNVFILRWQKTELADSARAVRLVRKAKELLPGPLVYIGIVPADEKGPDKQTRVELGRALDDLLGLCSCIHLVLEGKGFAAATQRAAATGIFLMAGLRGRVTPHASMFQALSGCTHLKAAPSVILAEATALGLVIEATRGGPGTREVPRTLRPRIP